MRVCILTETFHPIVGGGESQARSLAEEFTRRDHEVIVVTRRTDRSHARQDRLGAVDIRRIGPAGSSPSHKWGLGASVMPTLFRLRDQYDVLLVSGFRIVGGPAVSLARRLRKPCVLKADSLGEMSGQCRLIGKPIWM